MTNAVACSIEELKALQDQHKILLPDNMPPSPPPEEEEKEPNGDVKMADADSFRESPADAAAEDSDEDAHRGLRNLRRGQDRIEERKRKRVEEAERKREAELAAKQPKQSKQFIKLLKDIQKKEEFIKECEEEIAVIDNDLREADCPRTRVLGKDRFWNRYYWFERNGMPYGGLPDSSTAEAGYANGCIWVQGPYELEREGYIDVDMEYQREYKMKFKLTVPQRKKREEGATSLYTAYEWGYFDEPEQLDALIQWLDPRGFNELKLRKELVNFHDKIVQNMKNRRAYLKLDDEQKKADEANKGPDGAAKAEPTEEDKKPTINGRKPDSPPPLKRMSTRTSRALRQPTPPPPEAPPAQEQKYRCLKWHNLTAINELGHLHLEPPPPPAPQRGRKAAKKAAAAAAGRERRQEKVVEREPTPEPPPPRMMTRKALSRTNSARLR